MLSDLCNPYHSNCANVGIKSYLFPVEIGGLKMLKHRGMCKPRHVLWYTFLADLTCRTVPLYGTEFLNLKKKREIKIKNL
jgi:hypothetical protein